MPKHRGHYYRWKASPASLVSGITILCERYRSSLRNYPSQPANTLRIDGISALVAPSTQRIVKGILPADGWIDQEVCRAGY
jgi:hypothetical protein